ncbi:hypothetical protein [Nonomuraea sp. GTA35]|uniref:hypothetical protein n=1 Tax=Nonomuraea sp. GTA35 TaxID=1676746 RepID=UPI0035BF48F3
MRMTLIGRYVGQQHGAAEAHGLGAPPASDPAMARDARKPAADLLLVTAAIMTAHGDARYVRPEPTAALGATTLKGRTFACM